MNRQILKQATVAMVFMLVGSFSVFGAPDKATMAILETVKKSVNSSKDMSPGVKSLVIKSLLPLATDALFVKATNAQNAKKVALDEIKAIDQQWIKAESEMPIQKEVRSNECANKIVKLAKENAKIIEAFVMDNQGAVVCENELTSDYWQGDEEKWTNSYNGGKGGLDVGKVKFDKSANKNLQQVSIPVIDKGGKVIGAITFGLDVTGM